MIKYNDRFEFERDKWQWILTENVIGQDKNGNDKLKQKKSFYGTLRQVMNAICDKQAGECGSVAEIIELLSDKESRMEFQAESILDNN